MLGPGLALELELERVDVESTVDGLELQVEVKELVEAPPQTTSRFKHVVILAGVAPPPRVKQRLALLTPVASSSGVRAFKQFPALAMR